MVVRLVFLGRLADVAGGAECDAAPGPLSSVLGTLAPELAQALAAPRIRLALNGALVSGEGLVLKEGDELAFLPPVSGG